MRSNRYRQFSPPAKTQSIRSNALSAWQLIALGIGALIGAGILLRTAAAIAEHAGSSVTIAFLLAGVACAFAGLCYAEFASIIPVAGSAAAYSYATMGELVARIIGWDLTLEYAVGAATVAIAWSEYFNKALQFIGIQIPFRWCHSPFEVFQWMRVPDTALWISRQSSSFFWSRCC